MQALSPARPRPSAPREFGFPRLAAGESAGGEELDLFHVADDPAETLKIIKTAHSGISHK